MTVTVTQEVTINRPEPQSMSDVMAPFREALAAIVERTDTVETTVDAHADFARTTLHYGRAEVACDNALDNPKSEHYS